MGVVQNHFYHSVKEITPRKKWGGHHRSFRGGDAR